MIKAIIFDMDGLMIDSERVTFECLVKVLKDLNLTMTKEFYITLLGKTVNDCHALFQKEYGEGIDDQAILNKGHTMMAERFDNEGVPLKKGLIDLLKYLKGHNYKTIVATSSQRSRVDKILKQSHMTQYFDDSICGDEVKNGKPDPEVFLSACKKLHIHPDEAIVLEDSEAGIEAAHNADMKVICIPDMKYPDEIHQAYTYKILNSLDEVIKIL